ncbi:hypothetical protein BGX34_002897 [Mortierella sp. NVP85]|nr:hypothetical protein BGX34_002897 [Mortierella sp. NVP85]
MRYPERPKDDKPVERVLFPSSETYDCMVSNLAVAPIVPFAIHNSVNHEHGMKDHGGFMQSLDPRFMAHKKQGGNNVKVTGSFHNWERMEYQLLILSNWC